MIESTDRATESAERAAREKAEREEDYQRQQWRRWEQEQAERKRREAIKSIPPPPPMGKEQDLADYLDLFKSNMDSRDIPKEARAKHLLPLLNSKATAAIVGLPADSKVDMLLATVLETTKYASKAYWNMQKEAGESARATMVKILRMGKRFALGETPEQTLELISIEKFLQLFPEDVQAYCREKELKTAFAVADLVAKYCSLKGADELKYDSLKPWTYKKKEDKSGEERRLWDPRGKNHWQGNQHFKGTVNGGGNQSHKGTGESQISQPAGVVSVDTANYTSKQRYVTLSEPVPASIQVQTPPTNQQTQPNQNNHGKRDYRNPASRRCFLCGQYGHYKRDCPKAKQVGVAHVPSLSEFPNDDITIPGKVG